MPQHRNNANFKRIRAALELRHDEVAKIMELGGMPIGRDRSVRWARAEDAGPGRFTRMTNEEFDAFCSGLLPWASANLKNSPSS